MLYFYVKCCIFKEGLRTKEGLIVRKPALPAGHSRSTSLHPTQKSHTRSNTFSATSLFAIAYSDTVRSKKLDLLSKLMSYIKSKGFALP